MKFLLNSALTCFLISSILTPPNLLAQSKSVDETYSAYALPLNFEKNTPQKYELKESYSFSEEGNYTEKSRWTTYFTVTVEDIEDSCVDLCLSIGRFSVSSDVEELGAKKVSSGESIDLKGASVHVRVDFDHSLALTIKDKAELAHLEQELLYAEGFRDYYLGHDISHELVATLVRQLFKPYNKAFLASNEAKIKHSANSRTVSFDRDTEAPQDRGKLLGNYVISKENGLRINGSSLEHHRNRITKYWGSSEFILINY